MQCLPTVLPGGHSFRRAQPINSWSISSVEVYTIDGAFVGVSTINNGIATIQTGMPQGTIIIIKIGAKSIKTVIQ